MCAGSEAHLWLDPGIRVSHFPQQHSFPLPPSNGGSPPHVHMTLAQPFVQLLEFVLFRGAAANHANQEDDQAHRRGCEEGAEGT